MFNIFFFFSVVFLSQHFNFFLQNWDMKNVIVGYKVAYEVQYGNHSVSWVYIKIGDQGKI